jgi:hypothetical protein
MIPTQRLQPNENIETMNKNAIREKPHSRSALTLERGEVFLAHALADMMRTSRR